MVSVSYTAATLRQFANAWKLPTPPKQCSSHQLGQYGERLAAAIYRAQSWQILIQNYRKTGFELDIITRRGSVLAAVEVKTRGQNCENQPQLFNGYKESNIKRGLACYCQSYGAFNEIETLRIDLVICRFQRATWPDVQFYCGIQTH